jgi:divalent metal cation (Fe/Co/Zn/Cd) transporter
MIRAPALEFPPEQEEAMRKARRLEWITLAYISSAAVALYVTMGSSQAMRSSFFEDVISLTPAIAFLAAGKIALRKPSRDFPYGHHAAVSIGYLVASLALVAMGLFLLAEAAMKVIAGERTTIGAMTLFGHTVWAGWPMLLALLYSSIPSFILGRIKLKLAPKIHDKVLYADAEMMEADWKAEAATAVGVLGVGFGFWWLDPLAAAVVSLDILKDGALNLRRAVTDLMERRPLKTDGSGFETLPDRLRRRMQDLPWVEKAEVRLREAGHVFFGEVFVQPRADAKDLPGLVREAMEHAKELDWRLHDVTVTPVDDLKRLQS